MRTMTHIKVGDTVFVVRRPNRYRKDPSDSLGETKVVAKVGREYFYTDHGWFQGKFRRDSGEGADDNAEHAAFADEAAYIAAKAREGREQAVARVIHVFGRWHWERVTDEELAQLTALIEKLRDCKVGS